ncbi:uncharacterized protein LOC112570598 isoform X4 [Pomacea canaliculata]|uniref:uncharacterized protein LOC112570598 isoform X4 n=1 Tax=Pomacea canaliculata TaxID=400727 RepID=UPI000D7373E4|nr:uncharacterized protein LOC112570598 isoform X4 [Pomacea canaliculata]
MVITGINLQGSGESAVAQLNDTVSEEDSSAIATEDQAMIMQQMTEEIQENCNILADAINFDMPEENDTVAGSSLPKTSTPKRPFRSIENSKDSHTAK